MDYHHPCNFLLFIFMEQKASELFAEFEAIVDLLASGEQPSLQDRGNILALWGKLLIKLDVPIQEKKRFQQRRRACAAAQPFEDKEGKSITVAKFDHIVDGLLEADEPECLSHYMAACSQVDQILGKIDYLRRLLFVSDPDTPLGRLTPAEVRSVMDGPTKPAEKEDTGPRAPRKPRAKKVPILVPDEEGGVQGSGSDEGSGSQGEDQGSAEDAPEDRQEESVDSGPKSSFQRTLERAAQKGA